MSKMSDIHEERSDEWVRVDARMTDLVGGPAMTPGVLLWLDNGKRLLVGDVNNTFGTNGHCPAPALPIVRAWRAFVDMSHVRATPPKVWAAGFDLDEVPFEYCEEDEYPAVAELAMAMNRVADLDFEAMLRPGLVVGMEDGRVLLVGHVNTLAGTCDAQIDGAPPAEGKNHRVVRYFRAVPDLVFSRRSYHQG